MASNPQVAGKTFPAVCRASGSMVTGNMIPDMIMDGIKISCVAMPTLDELFAIQTEHHADAEAHHDEQQQEQKKIRGQICWHFRVKKRQVL